MKYNVYFGKLLTFWSNVVIPSSGLKMERPRPLNKNRHAFRLMLDKFSINISIRSSPFLTEICLGKELKKKTT